MIKLMVRCWLVCSLMLLGGGGAFAKEFHDWTIECNDGCVMKAEVLMSESTVFNRIEFYKYNEHIFAGKITFPLGVFLPDKIVLDIDGKHKFKIEPKSCSKKSCVALFDAAGDIIKEMKRGNDLHLIFTNDSDQKRMSTYYSLMGFTKVWKKWTELPL